MPSHVEATVEQRILEAWAGVPSGLVTGWAALRLYGGGFFEGLESDGRTPRDVPILVGHDQRPCTRPGVKLVRCVDVPRPNWQHDIAVTSPARSVFEAMRFARSERHAVTEVDMALAAGITTIAAVAEEMPTHFQGPGHRSGRMIGVPDLFDHEAGGAGEYDGAFHRDRERRRHEVARWEGFRAVGIETFTVVAGDRTPTVVARMNAARKRALPPAWRCGDALLPP